MNFFDLFGLDTTFELDLDLMKSRFLAKQQQFHPDQQPNQAQSTLQSDQINHAYQTLLSVDSRASYLLQLVNQDQGLDQSIHDFEFLHSALELREEIEQATSIADFDGLEDEVKQRLAALSGEFKTEYSNQDWPEARDTVRKMIFFQHVLADIERHVDDLDHDLNTDFDDDF